MPLVNYLPSNVSRAVQPVDENSGFDDEDTLPSVKWPSQRD
jgi:hypothetical protein